MTNKQKYEQVFIECFSIDQAALDKDVAYSEIEGWDSVGHMEMIAALEDAFEISMDTDDIIDFSSFKKGFELLAKYGISF